MPLEEEAILASLLFVFLDWVWEYAMIITQIWICQGEGPIGSLLGVPIIMLVQFVFLGIFLTHIIIIGERMDWFTAASPRKQLTFRLGFQIIFSLIATIGEFIWRNYGVTVFEDWVFWVIWGAWFSLVATLIWSFLFFQKLLEWKYEIEGVELHPSRVNWITLNPNNKWFYLLKTKYILDSYGINISKICEMPHLW